MTRDAPTNTPSQWGLLRLRTPALGLSDFTEESHSFVGGVFLLHNCHSNQQFAEHIVLHSHIRNLTLRYSNKIQYEPSDPYMSVL